MPDTRTLDDLVRSVGTGDQIRFAELYDRVAARVYAHFLDAGHQVAAERTRTAFVEIWKHAPAFAGPPGSAWSWMSGLVLQRA